METGKMILWLAQTLLALLLLFSVQISLRKKRKQVLRTVLFLIKAFLIPVSALLFVAIVSAFAYRHSGLLVAIYTALAADIGASILEFAVRQFRNAGKRQSGYSNCLLKLHAALSILLCACILFYGTFNALHVEKRTHTWQADGLTRAHTFAFAADLHMGSTQSMDVLTDLCRQINSSAPEFVILGGDVTDELTSHDDMLRTYQILSQINVPVYFIYGNHDRQPDCDYLGGRTYSDQELAAAIGDAGIHILSDDYVQIADDLVLLGREDVSMGDLRKS